MDSADIDLAAKLAEPLLYFPIYTGPFEFRAGLRRLVIDAGTTGPHDLVFQFDSQWPIYRLTKLQSRQEHFEKYVCEARLTQETASNTAAWLLSELATKHPRLFRLELSRHHRQLQCHLTNETLVFDQRMKLIDVIDNGNRPEYRNALDALCCQIQEDLAIVHVGKKEDSIAYLHLCLPNYWASQDKIGRDFVNAHTPVPGMKKIMARARRLVDMLAGDGPFERFTWGLTTDARLNHHPVVPHDQDPHQWQGRNFDPVHQQLYLRIERQVTVAIPGCRAFLFTIRTYLRDIWTLTNIECRRLLQAITTMPEDVQTYKGLTGQREAIINWLNQRLHSKSRHPG